MGTRNRILGQRGAVRRANKEGDIILRATLCEASCVDPALQVRWHLELEADVPASIVQVIVVKVNSSVLLGSPVEIEIV